MNIRYFLPIFLLISLISCGKQKVEQSEDISRLTSFRDVPGVTLDEIKAIEALKHQYDSFVYGMPISTEAFENEYSEVKGYTELLCNWLSEFFGIPFKPKLYEWLDLLAGLEKREVSFSGELTATEERQKIYHMTSDIASRPLKYYRLINSKPLNEIMAERRLLCGFIEGTATINTVVSELVPGTFEVVLLSDVNLVHESLRSGKIDAFYYSGTAEANFVQYSDIVTSYFYPLIYRPVSLTTQDPALAPIISVVEKYLEAGGIRYFVSLYNQGERDYLKYKLRKQLTVEELNYIRNHSVIPVGVDPGNYPISFYNPREKEWYGIFYDLLNEISDLTELNFERVNDEFKKWPEIYQMLASGKIAMVPELNQTPERQGQFLWSDTLQMIDFFALLSKSDYPNLKNNEILYAKVGLAHNTSYTAIFRKWFPHHMNTVEYESMEEALNAMNDGEVEMVMANRNRLLYLTHYLERPGYKANVVFAQPIETKFGFNKDEVVLCSIVNKALAVIDSRSIADQWLRKTYDYRTKMAEAQRPWLVGMTVLLLVLLTLIMLMLINRQDEGRRLEKLVQQRTVELNKSQQELEAALESAKMADRSKSAFLANMSHEIRTPMNSILGFSELATDGDVSPRTKDYLDKIHKNAEWLLQIINDILDISKIESGKMVLEKIPFDMHEIFSSCRTIILPKAVEKGIQLLFNAEPSLDKWPLGDPTRLRQVFLNLLSNSVKFTNFGKVKLTSEIKKKTDKTITMHFEIRDTGIGMTKEQVDKVFEPFIQAETGTTRKFGGTGLGLSITKNIVEMMGGKLSVESIPDEGSTFSFDITFDTVTIAEKDKLRKKSALRELEKPAFHGEILLCEDNVMNQQVICEHLGRVGLKTVVADNGKIGLEMVQNRMMLKEKQFDLIFMDMHMPVMDGLEASREIMKLNQGIPIVALTANIMSSDIEIYKESGMKDFVGKPFTSQELWHCLMKYFTPIKTTGGEKNLTLEADKEFQKNITLLFVKNNQKKYEEIESALEAGDIKLAHRLVHTLKSNAGQIGKTILQKAAANVENLLKNGQNLASEGDLNILNAELAAVLNELAPLLEESRTNEQSKAETLGKKEALELLDTLEPMVKSGNPESLKYFDKLRGIPGSGKLIQQMDDFDFVTAAETLAELQGSIKKQS
jgi:signal transduction histidine kinase/DNA-binding response OmpR family regulator